MAYLAAIYRLSSLPDLGGAEGDPLVQVASNFAHVPLFAGLAFCVLKSLAGARDVRWALYALAFAVCGACAVLDEWHQSFVPGRHGSTADLLLDLAGIGGMLFVLRLRALRTGRRWAADIGRLAALVTSTLPPLVPFPATAPVVARRPSPAGAAGKGPRTGAGD